MTTVFQARLAQRRKRRWILAVVLVLVLALVGAAIWAVWFSSLLVAQQVRVMGEERLSDDQVVKAAEVRLDTPLARLDTDAIEKRIREQLPPVEQVQVSRGWPDTVRIAVTEREPVAWITRSGRSWEVDASGVVFWPTDSPDESLLELRIDPDDEDAVEAAAATTADLLRLDPGIMEGMDGVSAETRDSVHLELADGRTIVWGSEGQAEEKLRVLKVLLDLPASVYDISVPTRPTTRE